VLSDIGPRAAALADGSTVVALAYSGRVVDDRTAEALYRINLAHGWGSFRDAARLWVVPAQNLVMAGRDGTIGMITAGRAPVRAGPSGRMPRSGWDGDQDWIGFVPFDDLPSVVNPAEGRIVEANNLSPRSAASAPLGDSPDEALRAARINELLDRYGKGNVKSSIAIQNDVFASDARSLLLFLAKADVHDERSRAALAMLSRWDFLMRGDRPEPLIYMAWLRELLRSLLAERLQDMFMDHWELRPAALVRMLADDEPWCVRAGGACAKVLGASLARALEQLAAQYGPDLRVWRWDAAHVADMAHPVWSRVPVVAAWLNPHAPIGGGNYTIGRAAVTFSRSDGPYVSEFGASFRAVYDLEDLSRSRFIAAPGQSGHPLSKHSHDLLDLWLGGGTVTVSGLLAELAREGSGTIVLSPK
jgi:penicillin amidase